MISRFLGVRKELLVEQPEHGLRRTLSWPHLVALGVGAIVGTGIYTLTGIGAERAGPAVVLAFAIAGAVCACAALCYAELATLIPSSGSAYTYCYTAIGRNAAWIIGWSLILEYSVSLGAVAVGWSGYLVGWIQATGIALPHALIAGPHDGGFINAPAVMVVLAVAAMLIAGTRESALLNLILVVVKLSALTAFVLLALPAFNFDNLTPFMPHGFASSLDPATGETRGVMAAAAIVFFAFYGFDAVATSAEEAKNPSRDVRIGILGSMIACVTIYMLVSMAAVGAVDYRVLAGSSEPLAFVLRMLDYPITAWLIGLAAIIALPSVILVMMFGQTRIFFAMSRDGLMPRRLASISPRTGTPVLATIITALFVALIAGFLPLTEIAELANAGTLLAFIGVAVAMIALRRIAPSIPRVFSCPAPYAVATMAITGCLYLMVSLPTLTLERFAIWNLIGVGLFAAMNLFRGRSARPA